MATLPFTDTHVHFHDFSQPGLRWDWLRQVVEPDPNLGDYGAIRSRRYGAEDFLADPRSPANWRTRGLANGTIGDVAPHMINCALALLGPIAEVIAVIT